MLTALGRIGFVNISLDGVMYSGYFSFLVTAHKLFNPHKLMMLL